MTLKAASGPARVDSKERGIGNRILSEPTSISGSGRWLVIGQRRSPVIPTEGVTVRVCRLLEGAAVQAIATGGERIELEALNEEAVTASLVSISDRRTRRTAA
jgi:hypothetical protein